VADAEELLGVLNAEATYLESTNPLAGSIASDGVREPLLVVPLTVRHENDDVDRTILVTADGSSRIAAAHKLLGLSPEAVVYELASNRRALRQLVARVVALSATSSLEDLSSEDVARIRAVEVPAAVVVGFVPDRTDTGDLALAINAKVAALHVGPPKQWSPAAKLDAQIDAALLAMTDAPGLEPAKLAWLAGYLTPDEADEAGFSREPDVRAAALLRVFVGRRYARRINQALRDLSLPQPGPAVRAELAAEAALRSVRSVAPTSSVDASRNLLKAAFALDTLRSVTWNVDEEASPDQLLEAALEELDMGAPGEAACQLAAMGLFWIATQQIARRTTRGGDPDRRDITTVLELMINSTHGMRVLHRVVVDCREGRQPRAVSARGTRLISANTAAKRLVDETWLRKTFAAGERFSEGRRASPESELLVRRTRVSDAVGSLTEAVDSLREPQGAGGPLVMREGLPAEFVGGVLESLGNVQAALMHYRYIARESSGALEELDV
jgi:hypothetical protein